MIINKPYGEVETLEKWPALEHMNSLIGVGLEGSICYKTNIDLTGKEKQKQKQPLGLTSCKTASDRALP